VNSNLLSLTLAPNSEPICWLRPFIFVILNSKVNVEKNLHLFVQRNEAVKVFLFFCSLAFSFKMQIIGKVLYVNLGARLFWQGRLSQWSEMLAERRCGRNMD
jgi:hypothetical protein